jgi:hypothetical protein
VAFSVPEKIHHGGTENTEKQGSISSSSLCALRDSVVFSTVPEKIHHGGTENTEKLWPAAAL